MANRDAPFGAIPMGSLHGGSYTGETIECVLLAATDEDAFVGDWVVLGGTASADGFAPSVVPSSTNEKLFGVITSFLPNFDDESTLSNTPNHRVGTELRRCNVVPAKNNFFIMQSDEDSSALAITDVNRNCDLNITKGSTITGQSAMEIDSSTVADATFQLRLHGLYRQVGNVIGSTAAGDKAIWIVSANELDINEAAGS